MVFVNVVVIGLDNIVVSVIGIYLVINLFNSVFIKCWVWFLVLWMFRVSEVRFFFWRDL